MRRSAVRALPRGPSSVPRRRLPRRGVMFLTAAGGCGRPVCASARGRRGTIPMKICMLGNQARSFYTFWRVLMTKMRAMGHDVVGLLPAGDAENDRRIADLGVEVVHYRLDRKGINPVNDIVTLRDLRRYFRNAGVDLLFASTIKPVIYGCVAARMSGVPHVYATITGLGYAFEADSLLKKGVHALTVLFYRMALSGCEGVFFQNRDDADLFRAQGILKKNARMLFANGTGVDTRRFAPTPVPDTSFGLTFLFVGRLLEAKGLREFVAAARMVKERHPDTVFQILGPMEEGLGSIPAAEVDAWQQECAVHYMGMTSDVTPFVRACHVLVLPSWREGLPTSVMEAMSMGRACLVTDVPGCREAVINERTGLVVPARDPAALAVAMERFIAQPCLAARMGAAGRALVEEKFDADVVSAGILQDMRVTPAGADS